MVKNCVTRRVTPVSTTDLLKGRLKANSKLNLSVNLLFSLIAVSSSDTTYCVPGIASHTFIFSFRLAISLKKWYINRSNRKNRKTKTVYWMNFCTAGYLRIRSSLKNAIRFIKTSFFEAIKYFRLSVGAIVVFEVFTLAGSQNWKKARWMPKRTAYILVWQRVWITKLLHDSIYYPLKQSKN